MEMVPDFVRKTKILQINSEADEDLEYDHNPDGLKVIAIGGNRLSRGLTLEGLTTSYFTRSSRMYDTLLQMGRWFGYRMGYEDLCRLYTTDNVIRWFFHISVATEELRNTFRIMAAQGSTPAEFGLKVRNYMMIFVNQEEKRKRKVLILKKY